VPAIDGTVAVGIAVTADPGTWSPAEVALSYQWLSSGTPIPAATSASYTPTAADVGQKLQVRVTGELRGFTTTSVTSPASVVAAGQMHPAPITVSGTPVVGGTITVDTLPWTPQATLSYAWLLDGSPIDGATTTSYRPVAGDAGHVLQVRVTGSAAGYRTTSVVSRPQTVARGTGSTVVAPTLASVAGVGTVVAAKFGAATPESDLSYRWLLDGAVIAGANADNYTPVPADAGKWLQVQAYSPVVSLISEPQIVAAAVFAPASRPSVQGTARVGQTLRAVTGLWAPAAEFSYQWLVNGRSIVGATEATLVATPEHAGKHVSVRVTATGAGYDGREETSDAVLIDKGRLWAEHLPRIVGLPTVGETLHVAHGDWAPRPSFSYVWYVDGRPAPGRTVAGRVVSERATGKTYHVRPEDHGRQITVKVTARKAGYETVTQASRPTPSVSDR
jgi:hypothetical protein